MNIDPQAGAAQGFQFLTRHASLRDRPISSTFEFRSRLDQARAHFDTSNAQLRATNAQSLDRASRAALSSATNPAEISTFGQSHVDAINAHLAIFFAPLMLMVCRTKSHPELSTNRLRLANPISELNP